MGFECNRGSSVLSICTAADRRSPICDIRLAKTSAGQIVFQHGDLQRPCPYGWTKCRWVEV